MLLPTPQDHLIRLLFLQEYISNKTIKVANSLIYGLDNSQNKVDNLELLTNYFDILVKYSPQKFEDVDSWWILWEVDTTILFPSMLVDLLANDGDDFVDIVIMDNPQITNTLEEAVRIINTNNVMGITAQIVQEGLLLILPLDTDIKYTTGRGSFSADNIYGPNNWVNVNIENKQCLKQKEIDKIWNHIESMENISFPRYSSVYN